MFKNLEQSLYQIKDTILDIEDVRKLLFYNDPSALTKPTPSVEEVEGNVLLTPIIYLEEDNPDINLFCFIAIAFLEGVVTDGGFGASLKISIAVNRDSWLLNNRRTRTLTLASLVSDAIHHVKFDMAATLEVVAVKEVYFSNQIVGITLLCDIADDDGLGDVDAF